jgi:hypothetical protein
MLNDYQCNECQSTNMSQRPSVSVAQEQTVSGELSLTCNDCQATRTVGISFHLALAAILTGAFLREEVDE